MKHIRKIILLAVLSIMFWFLASDFTKTAKSAPPYFHKSLVISTGLSQPITMQFAPDGRLFILERTGNVRIYKNGQLLAQPFVTLPAASNGDRGLIGVTFDPDYAINHYVYFYYAGSDNFNYLVRFDASDDIATEPATIIYQTTVPSERLHVGGHLDFGPDGKLYLAIGDNGYPPNSQDITNPFGKILRLNNNGTIPVDNPFYYTEGAEKAIWAYGLRNPWRFHFDTETGQMVNGDVGEDLWEEVNIIERGKNYGWPTAEGNCNCGFQDPFYAYPHVGPSNAITVGPTYHGAMFPSDYDGDLFFGDYAAGFLKRIDMQTGQVDMFDEAAGSVVDIKEAQDGSLYVLTIFPGEIFRYSYSEGNQPPAVFVNSDVTEGPLPLTVNFNSGGTFDPEGDPLTYNWDFGDGTNSQDANPSKIYSNRGSYVASLTVSDGTSNVLSQPLLIQAGTPPTVVFNLPSEGTTYRAGDTIDYEAIATDEFGNPIPQANYITEINHHRGIHIHPHEGPLVGVNSGSFYIPTFGKADPDQWYEIKITAYDADGLVTVKSRNIYPELSTYTVTSNTPGAIIKIDGSPWVTPKEVTGLIGFQQELSVDFIQNISGNLSRFQNWSDGGARIHEIAMPETPQNFEVTLIPTSYYHAQYFDNVNLSGNPVLEQDEVDINYLWAYGPPANGVPQDHFSVRWTKNEFYEAGEYEFRLTTDDGMRVLLDGNMIYDAWYDQSPTQHIFTANISEGNHDLTVEYYENEWEARASFEFMRSGDYTPTPTNNYLMEIWNYQGNSSPTFPSEPPIVSTQVNEISNNWGLSSPYAGINPDKFIIRWTKEIETQDATYSFETVSDDGIRVFVDGNSVINEWNDHGATAHQADLALGAGSHTLVVEYYENGWDAVAQFAYSQVSSPNTPPSGVFRAEYWNVLAPSIPNRVADYEEIVNSVNYNWGQNSPAPGIGEDHFVVRFSSIQNFADGNYTIRTVTDDGVRLYVDGNIVIDNWTDHGATLDEANMQLSGDHEVVMEFYENGWDAVAELSFIAQ